MILDSPYIEIGPLRTEPYLEPSHPVRPLIETREQVLDGLLINGSVDNQIDITALFPDRTKALEKQISDYAAHHIDLTFCWKAREYLSEIFSNGPTEESIQSIAKEVWSWEGDQLVR
jgi:hypothetical protein